MTLVNVKRYVDIFWETVAKYQAEGGKFEVYKVEKDRNDFQVSFSFGFEGFAFQLIYFQCGDLVRNFPSILDAEEEEVDKMSEHGRNVWHGVKWSAEQAGKVKYEVYHAKRALTIARGVYAINPDFSSERMFRCRGVIELPGLGPSLEEMRVVENMSVHAKWGMGAYLQVIGLLFMVYFPDNCRSSVCIWVVLQWLMRSGC